MNQFQEMLAQYFDARLKEAEGDEAAYRKTLEEKANAVRAGNSPDSQNLRKLENQLAQEESRGSTLSRIIDDGQLCYATAFDVINDLNRLNFHLLPGNWMSRLSNDYELVNGIRIQDARLQKELQRFRRGLADLGMRFDQNAEVGPLIRSDRAALDMMFNEDEIIGKAMYAAERMQALMDDLRPLLAQLEHQRSQLCAECEALKTQRIALIEQARIFPCED